VTLQTFANEAGSMAHHFTRNIYPDPVCNSSSEDEMRIDDDSSEDDLIVKDAQSTHLKYADSDCNELT